MTEAERDLVLAIQRAPLEERPWAAFLQQLRLALRGNLANLIFRRPANEGGQRLEVRDVSGVPLQLWERSAQFRHLDPIPYFEMQAGKVYFYEEFKSVQALTEDPFKDDFLRGGGLHHFLIFHIAEPSGCRCWVTVTRAEATGPFEEKDRALCERLADHLSVAVATHAALVRAQTQSQAYVYAANALSYGVIALDRDGRVLNADEAATRTLNGASPLSICRGRLRASENDAELQTLITGMVAADPSPPEPQSIHLGDIDGLDLMITRLPARADEARNNPRILVYVSTPPHRAPNVARHLKRLFGLTNTQAQLASLMSTGRSLAEAAADIGITEQSARTYSKVIYAKTGTSRQGELVQRILTSVAMLDAR